MTTQNNAAQAANDNPLSDEYVNAIIQRHGYDSPESVIAQLHQWIGLHGGEDTVTLLMYEAHKALSQVCAPVADEPPGGTRWPVLRAMARNYTAGKHTWDALDAEACEQAAEEIRHLRAALASVPVTGEAQQPVALVEVSVPHLRSISVKIIPDAPMPNVGDLLYAAPQASTVAGEAVTDEMIQAGAKAAREYFERTGGNDPAVIYRAMRAAAPAEPQPSAESARILFPTHLRKMWSGGEVQAWLDQHQGVTPPPATAKGSLARYRQWRAGQDQAAAPCTCPSGDGSLHHPCPAHPEGGSHGPASVCR